MRKYLQILFVILAIIAIAAILMWMGAVWAPITQKSWIATIVAGVIALILYIGYKGSEATKK